MRSHPVVGAFLLVAGVSLLVAGALGSGTPGPLAVLPLPANIVVPFVLWQLAVWCLLFGIFFLRPRGRAQGKRPRASL